MGLSLPESNLEQNRPVAVSDRLTENIEAWEKRQLGLGMLGRNEANSFANMFFYHLRLVEAQEFTRIMRQNWRLKTEESSRVSSAQRHIVGEIVGTLHGNGQQMSVRRTGHFGE